MATYCQWNPFRPTPCLEVANPLGLPVRDTKFCDVKQRCRITRAGWDELRARFPIPVPRPEDTTRLLRFLGIQKSLAQKVGQISGALKYALYKRGNTRIVIAGESHRKEHWCPDCLTHQGCFMLVHLLSRRTTPGTSLLVENAPAELDPRMELPRTSNINTAVQLFRSRFRANRHYPAPHPYRKHVSFHDCRLPVISEMLANVVAYKPFQPDEIESARLLAKGLRLLYEGSKEDETQWLLEVQTEYGGDVARLNKGMKKLALMTLPDLLTDVTSGKGRGLVTHLIELTFDSLNPALQHMEWLLESRPGEDMSGLIAGSYVAFFDIPVVTEILSQSDKGMSYVTVLCGVQHIPGIDYILHRFSSRVVLYEPPEGTEWECLDLRNFTWQPGAPEDEQDDEHLRAPPVIRLSSV